jgi:hypothetical protein
MDVLCERCCGLDIHKRTVVACLVVPGSQGQPVKEVRGSGTMSKLSEPAAAFGIPGSSVRNTAANEAQASSLPRLVRAGKTPSPPSGAPKSFAKREVALGVALPTAHPGQRHAADEGPLGNEEDDQHRQESEDRDRHQPVELGEARAAEQVEPQGQGVEVGRADVD